jgi:hypothetical protein
MITGKNDAAKAAALRVKRNLRRVRKAVDTRLPGLTNEEQIAVLTQYCHALEQVVDLLCSVTRVR